jgi:hypothetical protein
MLLGNLHQGGLVEPKITGQREVAEVIRSIRNEWITLGTSGAPTNRAAAERGFRALYDNKKKLKIEWGPSPLAGVLASLKYMRKEENQRTDYWNSLVNEMVTQFLEHPLYGKLRNNLSREVSSRTEPMVDAVSTNLEACIELLPKIAKQKIPDRDMALCRSLSDEANVGSMEGPQCCVLDFFDRAYGLDRFWVLRDIAQAGWFWCFKEVVVATERPTKVILDANGLPHGEKEAAITYADGHEVHCVHGTVVTKEVTDDADNVKWDELFDRDMVNTKYRDALARAKTDKWSKEGNKEESEEDRVDAAEAVKRLGGVVAMRDLVENNK